MGIANALTNFLIEKSAQGMLTFKDNKKLAFRVELYELLYNNVNKCFRLKLVNEPYIVRKGEMDEEVIMKQVLKPVFVVDLEDLFITVT